MGNSQSTSIVEFDAVRKRSHRLSKPKTGNHATAGLLSPGPFSNSSRRQSNRISVLPPPPSPASTPTTASASEANHPREQQAIERSASAVSVQQKESRRRSLFRSRSTQGSPDPAPRQRSIGPVARVADRLGRANSMTYESAVSYYGRPEPEVWQPPAGSRTSWNYDMSSYQAKRLLNLSEEPRFERAMTMSENKMTVVSETTWKSSNPTNPPSANLSRANSDVSLYMPVRRRSIIQKPGVATRSNSTHENMGAPRPNFRYSHPPTPSLSRQQSFESYRSGVLSMPPRIRDPEVPRVVTPCEDDYQSIGAFKLGSLRIVNGAASPVSPEAEKSRRKGESSESGQRDYFSEKSSGTAPATKAGRLSVASPKLQAPQPRPISLSPVVTSFLNLDSNSASSAPSTAKRTPAPTSPEYLNNITFSPFSLQDPLPVSPKLQTTSKTTALDDDLFEDEPQAEFSPKEVLEVRRDASAKPQPDGGEVSRSVSRTDSGFASGRSPSEYSHKALTKADSGYSSNVSLRSFQSKAQEKELTISLEKQHSQTSQRTTSVQSEERSMSSLSLSSHPIPPQREAPPPPVPPKDYPPVSPSQSRSSVTTRNSGSTGSSRTGASSKLKVIPAPISSLRDSGLKSPDSLPRTPGSARSTKSGRSDHSNSAFSVSGGSHKPSKLSRFLSSARRPAQAPVHTQLQEKASAPVLQVVEHKPQEHGGLFPLSTKRLALKPRASLDTLKTIFSVGSAEISAEAAAAAPSVPPKVPEAAEEDYDPKDASWRHSLEMVPSSIAQVAKNMIPRKPIARKPVPANTKEPEGTSSSPDTVLSEAELSTYSSVNTSLGINAYDAALIAMASSGDGALSPQIVSRTMSLTESAMRHLEMSSPALSSSPKGLPSPSLPSPLLARALSSERMKSSPPVSLANRRPGALRVPPPLRSQSSTASLSRKASRENIQSYPAAQPPLARKASRDSIRSYPSYQQVENGADSSESPPPIPAMDPRRISSFRHSQPSNYESLNWDAKTDQGSFWQPSRANSTDGHSRQSSMSSAPGQDGYGIQRPSSAQAWQVRTQPELRHRSSFDGFNLQQRRVQYGHPPSMSNGYTAPQKYDPWNSNGQFDPGYGQGLQDSRYPPYVPRGHSRSRSISRAAGSSAPYRVLHSYNSPAYRNAPIWG
ncbi:hypothetical protein QBC47DRAFT_143970 [Echria macrotheca]|uniref:Proteophosphoglycan ppg4 n=1 Tax=Echria macrotheca TaxID=438768 RepID=A0AAJ0BHW4_9PEZI|nr:hypothetical protein QBC47DRAFT_143970 [Echria macrotheca]